MTAGEGGCLTTNDERRASRARSYSNQGRVAGGAWYDHHTLGTNLRLTGFQAAVLLAQLERLDAQTARRNENAMELRTAMLRLPEVEPLCPASYCTRHALALFLFRFNSRETGVSKTLFEAALRDEGVSVMETYPRPLYGNPVFEQWPFHNAGCPVAEAACAEIVTLSFMLNAGADAIQQTIAALEKVLRNLDNFRCLAPTTMA
jgi:dTDP-4-amino-4,6-dideoxygalactose transaminase